MGKTINDQIILSNGQQIIVQTFTRQELNGEQSTFISINTEYFRIKIVQRISLTDLKPHKAKIGISTEAETSDLVIIETLVLALKEATKFAVRLNENVTTINRN